MSKLSIYETGWIDLVFENRNKEYGAYQLRKESVKTSLFAFLMGLFFLASIVGILTIDKYFSPAKVEITLPDITNTVIHLSDVTLTEIKKTVLPLVNRQNTETSIRKEQLINPAIVHPSAADPDIAKNSEHTNVSNTIANGAVSGTVAITPSETGTEISSNVDKGNDVVNTIALDKLPEFPGGINKFYLYVGSHFEKPEIDGSSTLKVYVSFVIEKDGSMTDIQVKKDPGYGLAKEAIRVLKSLKTKWSPGMIGLKPVRTSYNLPIIVQMD
jgi:hypothetical protein